MISGLAERLRDLRQKNGLSQRDAAKLLEVSPSIISGYETSERTPSVENLLALSRIYRCSTDYLLGKETATPSATLDVAGLTDQQTKVLLDLIRVFRDHPTTSDS